MQFGTGHDGHEAGAANAVVIAPGVAEGLALVAGALAELPAVEATCLPEQERGQVAAILADGWNLAAFTPTGSLLLSVLDAGGASIEVVTGAPANWGRGRRVDAGASIEGAGDDTSVPRATSHGAVRAASGAPPGRRIAAMGLVPGPDRTLIRMSCGLVLRLPAAALADPPRVAYILAWHAAMHAAERQGLPAPPRLAAAIGELDDEFAVPRRPAGRVAWANGLAIRVADEVGLEPAAIPVA